MFLSQDTNKKMLNGAYKKLKSYYHYNKNFVFIKQKIADFEYDDKYMDAQMDFLSEILIDMESKKAKTQINQWIEKIDFYVMPKSFVDKSEKDEMYVSSIEIENKSMNKVNFFIDMPIELHLLETLWTILLGKIAFDKEVITEDCYGNCIDNNITYNGQKDYLQSINFEKNRFFKIYFYQYCKWKNNSIEAVKEAYRLNKDTALFSLDIKSYYYSVQWKFELLQDLIGDDERYLHIKPLTQIVKKIFLKYTQILGEYKDIKQDYKKGESLLPIGMFCSMLLANMYLSEFDQNLKQNDKVLYYGRYVDDMLILLDVSGIERKVIDRTLVEDYLVDRNNILQKRENGTYCIFQYENLIIQKEKVKIINFKSGKASSLIKQLQKTITYPSQMNIIPDTELELNDFEEAAYVIKNFNSETKIRDLGQIEVDRFRLGWHMSQLVRTNRAKKIHLSREEKIIRQQEGDKILEFFQRSKALEYSSNWINALYYFLLTNRSNWKKFEANIRDAVKYLKIGKIEDVLAEKCANVEVRIKNCLVKHFDICVATALALYPDFSKKEKTEIKDMAIKLRRANLFNHYLVSFPLLNYTDNLNDNINLTNISLQQVNNMDLRIKDSRKSKLSPRFIFLDEVFQFVFLCQVTKGGNYYLDSGEFTAEKKIRYIENFFYQVNCINISAVKPLQIDIKNEKIYNKYILQKIKLGDNIKPKPKIKIAIANIKLDIKRCCYGLSEQEGTVLNKKDFICFLKKCYKNKNDKVDFLLFPEFYLPIQWISEVLSFVRKTGITVISGLQYITCNNQAYNNIAVFAPVITGKYRNSFLLAREKNDYAPMEQQLLAIKKHKCMNQEIPNYQIISNNGIDYGIFLCYEFTDIVARSLYKNQIDLLFTPEHNKDTSYFSNIIETTTRDLHTFIVQANTSIYGDSRITGPYSRNDRNIVQIKGGESDDIIIGSIDMEKVINYQLDEEKNAKDKIEEYMNLNKKKRFAEEKKIYREGGKKISKTSARFDASRLNLKNRI